MNELDISDYLVQKGIVELPREIRGLLERIMMDFDEDRTNGKAPSDFGDLVSDDYNLIPSKHKGACHSILIGVCYDRDNFEERVRECLDHASIQCKGINEEVYIISTQWNSFTVRRFKGYIGSLRSNGLSITFIHAVGRSFVMMPV